MSIFSVFRGLLFHQGEDEASEDIQNAPKRKFKLIQTEEAAQEKRQRAIASESSATSTGYRQPHFIYEPLVNLEDGFRLFRFVSTTCKTDNITCELSEHCLSEPPTYQALSYEWSSPKKQAWIRVNGRRFRVRRNLLIFLKKVRASVPLGSWIFADAICIDQSDLRERNTQVLLMGRIYSSARSVLAWIGPAADQSEKLYQLHNQSSSLKKWTIDETLNWIFQTPDPAIVTRALIALENRSYWNRMWIVQEVLLARDITIFCGSWAISWYEFERMLRLSALISKLQDGLVWEPTIHVGPVQDPKWAHNIASEVIQEKQQCRLRSFVAHRRITTGSTLGLPITEMVDLYGQSSCADVRDRIYGLLGVVKSSYLGPRLVPDYSKSELNLFFDVLRSYRTIDCSPFAILLNNILQLDEVFFCTSYKELTDRVGKCISNSVEIDKFRAELEYEGQVGARRVPLVQPGLQTTNRLRQAPRTTKMYLITGDRTSSPEDCLFTRASVKKGDRIVRIKYSELAFIYRIRWLKNDEVAMQQKFKEESYQEIQLVGRGVLLSPTFAREAAQFLAKDFQFCNHKESEVCHGVQFGSSVGIPILPTDMLIITTALDHNRKSLKEFRLDGKVSRTAPTDHMAAIREIEKSSCIKDTKDGMLLLLDAKWEHRLKCTFNDCELK
jgi:Heterokaryon incompatibility protein (HET)